MQAGFFSAVALPLFGNLAHVFTSLSPMLDAVHANFKYWQQLESA